jgi:Mrp family chromosome partitioning ATPase
VEGVDIIGCSGGDYTPTEVLPRNHLLRYLPKLLKKYDFIFMEGAPLNNFTDTKELIQFAEGVVLVISSAAKIEPTDKASIKYLKQQDDKFLGVILNKVKASDIKAA